MANVFNINDAMGGGDQVDFLPDDILILPDEPAGSEPAAAAEGTEGQPEGGDAGENQWDSPDNPYLKAHQELNTEVERLKKQLDEVLPKLQTEEQQKRDTEVQGVAQLLNTSGLTKEESDHVTHFYRIGRAIEASQDRLNEVAKRDHALNLALKHLTPSHSVGDLRHFLDGLMRYGDTTVMEEGAGLLAERLRQGVRTARVQSGAERIEGRATGAAGGGISQQELVNRYAAGERGGIRRGSTLAAKAEELLAKGYKPQVWRGAA